MGKLNDEALKITRFVDLSDLYAIKTKVFVLVDHFYDQTFNRIFDCFGFVYFFKFWVGVEVNYI